MFTQGPCFIAWQLINFLFAPFQHTLLGPPPATTASAAPLPSAATWPVDRYIAAYQARLTVHIANAKLTGNINQK